MFGDKKMKDITFVMLKPDAIDRKLVYEIISYFEKEGIYARSFDLQTVKAQIIKEHYAEHILKFGADFERKTLEMFENKLVIPIVLTGDKDIIAKVRRIVGATEPLKAEKGTIRGDLGEGDSYPLSTTENRLVRNLIHASDCVDAVRREAKLWLPNFSLD
jgi:nucleoside-diphosphate kinase